MESFFSLHSSSAEVFHGDTFSVFFDAPDSYWVVSNKHPCVFMRSPDLDTALEIMNRCNECSNYLNSKGIVLYD